MKIRCSINSSFDSIFETVTIPPDIDDLSMMEQSIQESSSQNWISHHLPPFAKTFVTGNDDTSFLIATTD